MNWPMMPIGSVADIITGKTPSTSEANNFGGNIPFVTPAELDHEGLIYETPRTLSELGAKDVRLVPENSVLVGCIGTLGKVGMAGRPVATNQQINAVVFDEDRVFPRYGFYAAKRLKPEMESLAPATTVKIISKSKFSDLKIPLPPLAEQKRIAGILDEAARLCRLRASAIETLNTLGQAIFQEMFGDPKTEPNRWPTIGFADACTDETSKSPKVQRGDYAATGPVPVVDQGQKLIAGYTDQGNKCTSQGPVILFGDHTRAVKFIDFDFAIGADGAKILKPSHRYEPIFFAALLARLPIPDLGYSRHMREVKKLRFPVPDIALQSLFSERMDALRSQERLLLKATANHDSLFTALQHRAFRGEL